MIEKQPALKPDLVEPSESYGLEQFCSICQVELPLVIAMVEEGVIETSGADTADWTFTYSAVTRIQRAYRLQRDLEINLPGVALSVDLLEEIDRLRSELEKLQQQLSLTK